MGVIENEVVLIEINCFRYCLAIYEEKEKEWKRLLLQTYLPSQIRSLQGHHPPRLAEHGPYHTTTHLSPQHFKRRDHSEKKKTKKTMK